MDMMKLLWVMSRSDRWYPSVPGDRGWNHRRESWTECWRKDRRTEDEDNMLGMTQKVSESININDKGDNQ